jgi:hypothetical protein
MMVKLSAKLPAKYRISDLKFKVLTSLETDIVVFWVMIQWCGPEGSSNILEEHYFHLEG